MVWNRDTFRKYTVQNIERKFFQALMYRFSSSFEVNLCVTQCKDHGLGE